MRKRRGSKQNSVRDTVRFHADSIERESPLKKKLKKHASKVWEGLKKPVFTPRQGAIEYIESFDEPDFLDSSEEESVESMRPALKVRSPKKGDDFLEKLKEIYKL